MKTLRGLDLAKETFLSPGRLDEKGIRTGRAPQPKTEILTSSKKVRGYQRNMQPCDGGEIVTGHGLSCSVEDTHHGPRVQRAWNSSKPRPVAGKQGTGHESAAGAPLRGSRFPGWILVVMKDGAWKCLPVFIAL